jgi:hypothetical protein
LGVGATLDFEFVTDAVVVVVCSASSTANPQRVELVAVAVAVPFRDVRASALVDCARAVAYPTCVERSHAVVHVVADAVCVRIGRTRPSAFTQRVKLVSSAIAVALGDFSTATAVDGPRSVAHSTHIVRANAVVHVIAQTVFVVVSNTSPVVHGGSTVEVACRGVRATVHFVVITHAVGVGVRFACAATFPNRIEVQTSAVFEVGYDIKVARLLIRAAKLRTALVDAIHITVGFWAVIARIWIVASRDRIPATHPACVYDIAIAVARAVSDAFTATYAALVEDVAVAVASTVSDAFTAANAALVPYVAVAVAFAVSDAVTAANATLVQHVAVAVASAFSNAFTAANAALVQHVAVAVASAIRDACTAANATAVEVQTIHQGFKRILTGPVEIASQGVVTK